MRRRSFVCGRWPIYSSRLTASSSDPRLPGATPFPAPPSRAGFADPWAGASVAAAATGWGWGPWRWGPRREAKTAAMRKGTAAGAGPGSRAAVLLLRSTPPRGHPFPRPAKSRRICRPLGGLQCRGGGGGLELGTVEAGSTAGGPGRRPWSGNAGSEPPLAPSQDSVSPCRHQRLAGAAQDAGGGLDRRAPARGNECWQPWCHAMACCPVLSRGSARPPRVVFTSPHIVSSPSPTPSFPSSSPSP
ncbi:unnamed protein product [Urochloa humidicola]